MITIHNNPLSFSKRWIEFCKKEDIHYKIVNAFSNQDREIIFNSKGFMWHWFHNDFHDKLIAKGLINACEIKGIKTFPNILTCNHYDNKIDQQFLFESLDIPCAKGFIFTDLLSSKNWIKKYSEPFVFKLSSGAGSYNVKLIKSQKKAFKIAEQMFYKGKEAYPRSHNINEAILNFQRKDLKKSLLLLAKAFVRYFYKNRQLNKLPKENNYFYAQEFIPNNSYDHRIIIIGEKAICLQREVRKNDFRASGSNKLSCDPKSFPLETIDLAFRSANLLKMQCAAFDIIYNEKNEPLIVEISYCFSSEAYRKYCHGYFDKDLNWHKSEIILEDIIIKEFLKEII